MGLIDGLLGFGAPSLRVGQPAPDFTLPDGGGKMVRLSEFRGRKAVVLYFYPKDDTPGCTKESCAFRDSYQDFLDAGAEVIGVSGDDSSSHERFATKYNLPFVLLSDRGGQVRAKYGVPATWDSCRDGSRSSSTAMVSCGTPSTPSSSPSSTSPRPSPPCGSWIGRPRTAEARQRRRDRAAGGAAAHTSCGRSGGHGPRRTRTPRRAALRMRPAPRPSWRRRTRRRRRPSPTPSSTRPPSRRRA